MNTHTMPGEAASTSLENDEGCAACRPAHPSCSNENSRSNYAEATTEIKGKRRAKLTRHTTVRNLSTSTEAQRERILAMLRTGEKSTFDFRRAGIMQSSTRIHELRARGYGIETVARRDLFDADGYRHERVAVYAMVSEPDAPGAGAQGHTHGGRFRHEPGMGAS